MPEIEVVDYQSEWPTGFEAIVRLVWPRVRARAERMEHVGSTAVPGLAAKPIIDVDVVVVADEGVGMLRDPLTRLGYGWQGDLGVEGRDAYGAGAELTLPPHHLYVVADGSRAYLDHVLLRDLLRRDGDARARYAALKRRNAQAAHGDVEAYTAMKAALVAELLTAARAARGMPDVSYWVPTSDELRPRT